MEKTCNTCGSELVNGICPNCSQEQQATYTQPQVNYEQSTDYASDTQNTYQQYYHNGFNYGVQNAYSQNYQNGYNNNGQNTYQQSYQNGYNTGNQCPVCGSYLINGVCPNCSRINVKKDSRLKNIFMSPKEEPVSTLGNTYIQTFLNNGYIRRGFAVISNKRVYFQGTTYSVTYDNNGKKKINKTNKSQVVDLKDVTGTGFEQTSTIEYLIAGIASLIIMIISLLPIL